MLCECSDMLYMLSWDFGLKYLVDYCIKGTADRMQSVYREVLFTLQLPVLIPTVHCQCRAKLVVKYRVRKIVHNVRCQLLSCAVRKVFVNVKDVYHLALLGLNVNWLLLVYSDWKMREL